MPRSSGLLTSLLEPRKRLRGAALSTSPSDVAGPFATAFELRVADGIFVALRLPQATAGTSDEVALPVAELHDLEVQRMEGMRPARRISFAGGRVAMRRALTTLCADGAVGCPVLPDEVGAPTLPLGTLGSISHTHGLVAAMVCMQPDLAARLAQPGAVADDDDATPPPCAVGVDVERASRVLAPRAANRCLHADERETLDNAPSGLDSAGELLLRVSIKEALYKALHPLLRTSIRWHSVQVQPRADGSCAVQVADLEERVGERLRAEASWRLCDGYVVAMAHASRLGG